MTQAIVELDERAPALPGRSAFSIQEFCWRQDISQPTYFKLKLAGLGPKEIRLGQVVRISLEAEAEWQRMMAAAPQGKARAKAQARSRKAAKLSVASPRHVSKQRKRATASA